MNYEKVVRDIVLPIVEDKDQLMVKLMPTDDENDLVVITAGVPVATSGTTNLVKVETI